MPSTNKATAPVTSDLPEFEERSCDLADMTVNFLVFKEDVDLAPILANLPTGLCECPHWGVVGKGRVTARYPGQEDEVYEPGDVFYMTPGHTAAVVRGTELAMISPSDLLAATDAAIAAAMQGAG